MKELRKAYFKRAWLILLLVLCCQLVGCKSNTVNGISANKVIEIEKDSEDYEPWVDTSKFYYSQLTDIEKSIYDAIYNSRESIINNRDFYCISGPTNIYQDYFDYINRALYAYLYDNPEARIYISLYKVYTKYSSETGYYDYFFAPSPDTGHYTKYSSEDVKKMLEEMENVSKEFVDNLSGTTTEKLIQINEWLIEEASYDETLNAPNTNDAYGAIIRKNCVCGGYAYAYKYIADMAGLDVLFVTGEVFYDSEDDSSFHAWNYAYVNGKWYLIDPTWNINFKKSNCGYYNYLLLDPKLEPNFGTTHKCSNGNFVYPHE